MVAEITENDLEVSRDICEYVKKYICQIEIEKSYAINVMGCFVFKLCTGVSGGNLVGLKKKLP